MGRCSELREAAILRTLRDIECGHITLRCSVRRYDARSGEPLATPMLEWTMADRPPAAGFPRRRTPWWDLLAERGWIRPPVDREPSYWQMTAAGRQVLDRWTAGTRGRKGRR
jgi:hypothetical protein